MTKAIVAASTNVRLPVDCRRYFLPSSPPFARATTRSQSISHPPRSTSSHVCSRASMRRAARAFSDMLSHSRKMPNPDSKPTALRRRVLFLFGMLVALTHYGQPVSSEIDAATLAKYDKNHNGRLDPNELEAKEADDAKASGTIRLTPFEVSSEKDRG